MNPADLKKCLKYLFYLLIKPKLKTSHVLYLETDEFDKFKHILEAVNYVRVAGVGGDFMEFGCHSGRTFAAILNAINYFRMSGVDVHAFDSFEGLPNTLSDDEPFFRSGMFKTSKAQFVRAVKQKTGIRLPERLIHAGFYEETLEKQMSELDVSVSFIHIDVDLFASTIPILDNLTDRFSDGAVILFDDYYCYSPNSKLGERHAFETWLMANKHISAEHWKNYSTFGSSFILSRVAND